MDESFSAEYPAVIKTARSCSLYLPLVSQAKQLAGGTQKEIAGAGRHTPTDSHCLYTKIRVTHLRSA